MTDEGLKFVWCELNLAEQLVVYCHGCDWWYGRCMYKVVKTID